MLPELYESPITRNQISTFGGYDHNIITDAFFDMKNLSSDDYPSLGTRGLRSKTNWPSEIVDDFSDVELYCQFKNGIMYRTGDSIRQDVSIRVSDSSGVTGAVPFGSFSVLTGAWERWEYSSSQNKRYKFKYVTNKGVTGYKVLFVPVKMVGDDITIPTNASEELIKSIVTDADGKISVVPTISSAAGLEFDKDGNLNQWSPVPNGRASAGVATTYFGIKVFYFIGENAYGSDLFSQEFEVGESIQISGCTVKNSEDKTMDGSYLIRGFKDGWMIISHVGEPIVEIGEVTFERVIPDIKHVIECNNRLWGVTDTEIHASALGKPGQWQTFAGDSTDSWVGSVGNNEPFTGACVINNMPVFFKSNMAYIISGDIPSTFVINKVKTDGVENGSSKSVAVIDEVAYYKGHDGVYAFDGTTSVKISRAFGNINYSNGIGAKLKGKYYISLSDGNKRTLFVYDTNFNMWHKEDDINIISMVEYNNDIIYNTPDGIYSISRAERVNGVSAVKETEFDWYAESGMIEYEDPDCKYISKITLRAMLGVTSEMSVQIDYNSSGEWRECGTVFGKGVPQVFVFPIIPARCDHFRLRISGRGECKVLTLTQNIEGGSDVTETEH